MTISRLDLDDYQDTAPAAKGGKMNAIIDPAAGTGSTSKTWSVYSMNAQTELKPFDCEQWVEIKKASRNEVAKLTKLDYSSLALSKISKSTLAGCNNKGVHSPHRAFFVRYLSMPMHILYASCGGRTSPDVLVTFITSLLTDPHGLRQSFSSEVQAFNQNKGAHSHA